MTKKKNITNRDEKKVLIVVRGGVVQNVFASNPDIAIDLLDFDNEAYTSDELAEKEFKKRRTNLQLVF